MSSVHVINGKTYTPATDVGRHFGYSKDYILMLVKQGKIDGQKIGHKWYADLPSAEMYFNTAKQEQVERRKQVSQERKAELKKFTYTRVVTNHRTAILETLVIVVIGLSLGVTSYLGTVSVESTAIQGSHTFLENLALSLYTTLTPEDPSLTQNTPVPLEESAVSAKVGTTTHTSLIIAPGELFTATTVESIQDSFADPVTVTPDPANPETGIITPQFRDREGEAYRFLMVPVITEEPMQ